VNQTCWYESTSVVVIILDGVNQHVKHKTGLLWYEQHFFGMNKDLC